MPRHFAFRPLLSVFALALLSLAACSQPALSDEARAVPAPKMDAPLASRPGTQTAVFAGGCFWGMQWVFEHVNGVTDVTAGYSGGDAGSAHYERVSEGDTGHAESVQVRFDPAKVSYGQLLRVYFSVATDPTELNRQGPDVGAQYRGVIFYADPQQQRIAQAYITQLTAARIYAAPIVTQVVPLKSFYPAEGYHQDYARLNPDAPYIAINDAPKVSRFAQLLPGLYHARPIVHRASESIAVQVL
ncbi:MAG TPA: peptide-methionine (S)-S-oxide reductase MsrA [Rhodanobacteraceae bacterium]|nr:peptide-methionine (S)-S-oxide reductase MsrA [Rhodanobacteraceae bacterium]